MSLTTGAFRNPVLIASRVFLWKCINERFWMDLTMLTLLYNTRVILAHIWTPSFNYQPIKIAAADWMSWFRDVTWHFNQTWKISNIQSRLLCLALPTRLVILYSWSPLLILIYFTTVVNGIWEKIDLKTLLMEE